MAVHAILDGSGPKCLFDEFGADRHKAGRVNLLALRQLTARIRTIG
jgi:hypothetical protein